MEAIQTLLGSILGNPECAATLLNVNLFDSKCLPLVFSKMLGYVMLVGSMSYKMPVIMNIRKKQSGAGLDLVSLYLEASACTANFYYNYAQGNPITTYGDVFSANMQNLAIIALVWMYGMKDKSVSAGHVGTVIAAAVGFVTAMLYAPESAMPYVASYGVYMVTVSRIPQIICNFRTRDVGVQSLFTSLNAALGALAKVVMALVETPDFVLISGAAVTFLCNSTLLFQILTMPKKGKKD